MLKVKIDEKLNVNKDNVTETLIEQIEEALPALEEAIIKRLGNDPYVRNFDFGLTVEEHKDRSGNPVFVISSNNLVELTGPIGKITYEEFVFETWGGTKVNDPNENKIWFNPKFSFKYKNGGSNGADALWSSIWYDIDEYEWIFGRAIS